MSHQTPTQGIPQEATEVLFREISRTMFQDPYKMNNSILSSRGRSILRYRLLESPCGSIINIEDTIALRSGQAFLDLLKSALYLISNNIAEHTGIGPLIISACQLPTTGKALERLLQLKTPTVQAFADGLLHYASKANDAALVQKLIHSGISANSRCGTCNVGGGYKVCRLQCAIRAKADRAATALLDFGANSDIAANGECLTLAFRFNLMSIADKMLERGAGDAALWKMPENPLYSPTWDVLSTAALYGGMPAVKILTQYHPSQLEQSIQKEESAAFMMAAMIGNEMLVQFWLTKYNVSAKSCAIGLCGAAANGQTQMVELLLSYGSNVDGDEGWIYHRDREVWRFVFCDVSALEAALGSGHLATARVLIGHGANTNIKTLVLNTILWPMFDSESRRHYGYCQTLQKEYEYSQVVEPAKFNKHRESSMWNERLKIFRQCLDSGAEPDEGTVVWLSFAGALDYLRSLVEQGISINAVTTTNFDIFPDELRQQECIITALTAALYAGNDDVAEYLLQNEADMNATTGMNGSMSPLAASIIQDRLDWTKTLICGGASPKDIIALWAAAHMDNVDAYDIIDTASQDMYGHGVAEHACVAASEALRRGNTILLYTIVQRGIQINNLVFPWRHEMRHGHRDMARFDHPLAVAVRYLDLAAVQLLLEIGANPNVGDDIKYDLDGRDCAPCSLPILNCLPHSGSSRDMMSIADVLIKAGAKINYHGPTKGHSPLVDAIWCLRPMVFIELLIRRGALVNALSVSPFTITTPLCEAVCSGSYQVVQLLLAEGARASNRPQLEWRYGPRSPIQIAAHNGHIDILTLLLEALDEESQFISQYPLALRLAQRAGHRAVARFLQAYRAERVGNLECATDEVILKDYGDPKEDRKYWYEFWNDENFKAWRSISHLGSSEGNFEYVLGLCSSASSVSGDTDSEKDGSVSNTMNNFSEKHNCEADLNWQEYFDFGMAQHPGDMESYGLATDGSQLSTFVDHWPFDDVSQAYKPDNEVLSVDDLSMTQSIGASDFPMLGEQIWGIEECIDQAPWEGFFDY